jgi:hypothetical protein
MAANRYTSDLLYHFVGFGHPDDDPANYETLTKIIRSRRVIYKGYVPGRPGLDCSIDWSVDVLKGELISKSVTCYGDIPREALQIHMNKYGRIGLGFMRNFLIRKGVRPVIYMPAKLSDYWDGFGPNRGKLAVKTWLSTWDAFNEYVCSSAGGKRATYYVHNRPRDADEAILRMEEFMEKDFLPFLKAFNPDLADDHIDNFYMEREWRLRGILSFSLNDIAEVILPEKFIERLIADFQPLKDRIVTTEQLSGEAPSIPDRR